MMPTSAFADKSFHRKPPQHDDNLDTPLAPDPTMPRPLGTMIIHGFPKVDLANELLLAHRLGAACLEILPNWRANPDPSTVREQSESAGFWIHSVHGCWGSRAIRADRVDLSSLDQMEWNASVSDAMHCIDWAAKTGAKCLVLHPGGLSDPDDFERRRGALTLALERLARHARGSGVTLGVENMPPGVHPGSRMADLAELLAELDCPELALVIDTGHANIVASAEVETLAAGPFLCSTHVHDNDGKQDTHRPPGFGTVNWGDWVGALDAIGYQGPIMLECIRHLREHPETLENGRMEPLTRWTRRRPKV